MELKAEIGELKTSLEAMAEQGKAANISSVTSDLDDELHSISSLDGETAPFSFSGSMLYIICFPQFFQSLHLVVVAPCVFVHLPPPLLILTPSSVFFSSPYIYIQWWLPLYVCASFFSLLSFFSVLTSSGGCPLCVCASFSPSSFLSHSMSSGCVLCLTSFHLYSIF